MLHMQSRQQVVETITLWLAMRLSTIVKQAYRSMELSIAVSTRLDKIVAAFLLSSIPMQVILACNGDTPHAALRKVLFSQTTILQTRP